MGVVLEVQRGDDYENGIYLQILVDGHERFINY